MTGLRKLIHAEVLRAVGFVLLGFASLFLFFDLMDELPLVGQERAKGYKLQHALTYALLQMPGHLYELIPICLLIGTIFVMARLAQSSEFTILRTSGLGPWQALRWLLGLGLMFVLLTFALGDYAGPFANRAAQLLKARYTGQISLGQTGAWLKEKQQDRNFSVNIGALAGDASMSGVRIFEFDARGYILSITTAARARFEKGQAWALEGVQRTDFQTRQDATAAAGIERTTQTGLRWPTGISAEMVSAALLSPDRMKTLDLFEYIRHLRANGQSAQKYEIEFWRKVFYPLSCLVMVVMALPFAYLHLRSGGIAGYVFGGVMVGISFFLLNNVFGFIGNLQHWTPWMAAAAPSVIYSLLSLGAFAWLVLRR